MIAILFYSIRIRIISLFVLFIYLFIYSSSRTTTFREWKYKNGQVKNIRHIEISSLLFSYQGITTKFSGHAKSSKIKRAHKNNKEIKHFLT